MQSATAPIVAAIVVAHERASQARACIESVLGQNEVDVEVVVVLNGASDGVVSQVESLAAADARVRVVKCAATSASEARNLGVAEARAQILYFLDDDVVVPEHGVGAVKRLFQARPEIAIAGGPNLTPPDDPEFAHLSGDVLASPFGTGITRLRYVRGRARPASEQHLTLCNLAVRRSLFERGLRFPTVFGGEENVLMGHAKHRGHEFWYSPELWVYHRRRRTFAAFLSQITRYGFGRAIAMHTAPRTVHPAYFAPLALIVYLLVLPVFAIVTAWAFVPLAVYGFLVLAASAQILARRPGKSALVLPALFPMLHVAYALGFLRGLARGFRSRESRLRSWLVRHPS